MAGTEIKISYYKNKSPEFNVSSELHSCRGYNSSLKSGTPQYFSYNHAYTYTSLWEMLDSLSGHSWNRLTNGPGSDICLLIQVVPTSKQWGFSLRVFQMERATETHTLFLLDGNLVDEAEIFFVPCPDHSLDFAMDVNGSPVSEVSENSLRRLLFFLRDSATVDFYNFLGAISVDSILSDADTPIPIQGKMCFRQMVIDKLKQKTSIVRYKTCNF